MMFFSRNTILTALLLVSTVDAEDTGTNCPPKVGVCDNPVAGTACTYQDSCTAPGGDTRLICDAQGSGIAAGNPGFCAQLLEKGNFVSSGSASKSNTESDMADVDVGATAEAAPVEAQSTSGGSTSAARVASYLFLAAVGGAAATIVGL